MECTVSLLMITWDRFLNGLEMGMYHNPSALFLCPFKISFEYLIILISFLIQDGDAIIFTELA